MLRKYFIHVPIQPDVLRGQPERLVNDLALFSPGGAVAGSKTRQRWLVTLERQTDPERIVVSEWGYIEVEG